MVHDLISEFWQQLSYAIDDAFSQADFNRSLVMAGGYESVPFRSQNLFCNNEAAQQLYFHFCRFTFTEALMTSAPNFLAFTKF